jgi:hypothetical protein
MATVDEVIEGVSTGGLVTAFADLAEADIVNDDQRRTDPSSEALGISAVSQAGVQVGGYPF